MPSHDVVIVGAGHSGCAVATQLRAGGHQGRVTLISAESAWPYHRPPLSKAFLEDSSRGPQWLRGEASYAGQDIRLLRGTVAAGIDRTAQRLLTGSGESIPYDRLVLATGSRPRPLQLPGAGATGVHTLQNLADAEKLRDAMGAAQGFVLIGGGFVGLEVAATLSAMGKTVHLVEQAPRLLERAIGPDTSAWLAAHHRCLGVRIDLNAGATEIITQGQTAVAVRTSLGDLPADVVLLAAGAIPDTRLAEQAGLVVAKAIIVDEQFRTSDPNILACGDCAVYRKGPTSRPISSVQNANDQARHVALSLLGRTEPFVAVPWFWSDQGMLKLQIAGIAPASTLDLVRGTEAAFSVFRFDADALVSVESINQPAVHMMARRLLARDPIGLAEFTSTADLRTLLSPSSITKELA